MSIAESLVDLIADEARKGRFRRASRIRVQLGALGHVEPEALLFCFDVVAKGTVGEGAELDIETVPGTGWCPACRRSVPIAQRYDPCPACGSHVEMTAGDELRLVELEVE
ncbi:MAG TPA: hydrogenase maturation nickel metallochaperone HypA [Rhodopila sp.]|uniref:hydrogenase maturation nickel metallochaperone HypA/HybF n=1 Tax=Rhodopila sp. TaxID=2480087 RepID=UPI002B9BCD96|nr:hydrogenase maturation nickel metallochaperone HypA [Rhodopila sp.]HVY15130.1 hydrogenase maturation nickel metallochaperone HypA [Rhodopila sp.]